MEQKTAEQLKEERHQRYLKDRHKCIAQAKRYYEDHKEERKTYNAIYYNENKAILKQKRHEYYLKNKERWKNSK